MKVLGYITKRKGFLFISTILVITVLLFNLLIGYRIILRRGERVEKLLLDVAREDKKYTLETLAYSELRRIDEAINSEEYENGAHYVGVTDDKIRVWFGNTNNIKSKNGYTIFGMRINDKKRFYIYKPDEYQDLEFVIKRELLSYKDRANKIGVELDKKIVGEDGSKIYIRARVDLYYEAGNTNPLAYTKEVLKDFELGYEK